MLLFALYTRYLKFVPPSQDRECLDDNMREEILNVLDLSRCSASGLQEALDNNILPPRAVAEAALRFAKQSINTGNNASLDRLVPPFSLYYLMENITKCIPRVHNFCC